MQSDELIITADTIVWLDGEVMGKPVGEEDARRMLRALSGKTHQVITGVCLTTIDSQKAFATVTDVTFCHLSEEEIDYYVERYRPMDKAGSYGIQEWIGFVGVESISGSYFNVMGLPIQRLYTELKKL
jgi:septum formation protein